jgi:hypothetical protein
VNAGPFRPVAWPGTDSREPGRRRGVDDAGWGGIATGLQALQEREPPKQGTAPIVPAISKGLKNMKMRCPVVLLTAAGLCFGSYAPAHAIGCLTGGMAGAVAGHMAHHGVLGAIGGCIAGHQYNKHQKRTAAQRQSNVNQSDHASGTQSSSGTQPNSN